MSFDISKHKEAEYIIPLVIEEKERYYLDLINLQQNYTGKADVMFSNEFFREANKLIINAIVLFEKGFIDCSFYSLRQAMEIATTTVYFSDDEEVNRQKEFAKWKKMERFPMYNQMIGELEKRKNVFADIKEQMSAYFTSIEETKQKLNKYVHKQGYDTFYVSRSRITPNDLAKWKITITSEFKYFLDITIGSIAVFRIAVDPFPILLADEAIYKRTGRFITEGYYIDFIEKYIGKENVDAYKRTILYKSHYDYFIDNEEMNEVVLDVVKNEFIDKTKIDKIILQMHLLGQDEIAAVSLMSLSEKIVKVYCNHGLRYYFCNIQSKRKSHNWSSSDFDRFSNSEQAYNFSYDESNISCIKIGEEKYFIEHNDVLNPLEIEELEMLVLRLNKMCEIV
ncbi:MAG: hypothetical protein JWN78_2478 [Bacteroidota bacterium]|nr:hypothetical protein [Bacteroidota bacterium]